MFLAGNVEEPKGTGRDIVPGMKGRGGGGGERERTPGEPQLGIFSVPQGLACKESLYQSLKRKGDMDGPHSGQRGFNFLPTPISAPLLSAETINECSRWTSPATSLPTAPRVWGETRARRKVLRGTHLCCPQSVAQADDDDEVAGNHYWGPCQPGTVCKGY